MHHLILITSDPDRMKELVRDLRDLGYPSETMTINDLESGLAKARPDIVLLDLGGYGGEALSAVRRTFKQGGKSEYVPVVGLADRRQLRRTGIDLGLDDFALPPYDGDEIDLRIRHVLWRTNRVESGDTVRVGDLIIDLVKYETRLGGTPIDLTYKEYELLRHLAINRGKVYSRESLLDKIWGYDYYGGMRTVDVHIRRLRAKLDIDGRSFIKTIRNVGYKLEGP